MIFNAIYVQIILIFKMARKLDGIVVEIAIMICAFSVPAGNIMMERRIMTLLFIVI